MRLIDADALKDIVETARKKARTLTGMDFVMTIENAPTIYAIPVEWLHEKMQKPLMTSSNPFVYVMAELEKKQEAR